MEIGWLTRLALYCVISTLIGPFYDNWTTLEKWLYREGAYIDSCKDVPDVYPFPETWYCAEQQSKVSGLLPISRIAECSMSVFIGIFMDFFGPRITAVFGTILRIIGWTLMSFAVHAPGGLVISFLLMGLTTNFIVFPCLTIGMYTRKYRHIAVLLIGMCSCFASMMMKVKLIVLQTGVLTAKQVNYLYTIVFMLPCLGASILFMPDRLKEVDDEPEPMESVTTKKELDKAESSIDAPKMDNGDMVDIKSDTTSPITEVDPGSKWTLRGYIEVLSTKEVFVCLWYFAFNFSSITYVQQTYGLVHRDDAFLLELNEYMIPLGIIPCLIFAVLYMYIEPIYILIFMNTMGILMHLFVMASGRVIGILLSFSLVMTYSILNTQVYNYLERLFHETYLGSIVGALNGMCGIWMLIQMFVLQHKTSPSEINVVTGIMALLRGLFLLPFFYFIYDARKRRKTAEKIDSVVDSA
ncbi:major facilitator superfamily protein MFS-1 [Babesia ovis]|uniref:Major facilitator superfamily protein MFS-1 n=1 Tax=Babesia ovis TaxID=5869 RepID=A0A9W5TCI0_BABOV|nr:major facilitator superfamily protein MFS-1 [Babesia ovis]